MELVGLQIKTNKGRFSVWMDTAERCYCLYAKEAPGWDTMTLGAMPKNVIDTIKKLRQINIRHNEYLITIQFVISDTGELKTYIGMLNVNDSGMIPKTKITKNLNFNIYLNAN